MPDAINDLTDKEKEALRLLLGGHDAKSSAIALGISVHTVNDRLRNARRKLSVSSSREAARILGDAEGGAPQNLAPAQFGMETETTRPETADLDETRRTGPSRAVWLTGGMLIMSLFIAAIVVTMTTTGGTVERAEEPAARQSSAGQAATATPAGPSLSMQQAEAFLALVDDGDWEESWNQAGPYFQSQTSVAQWTEAIEPVRTPLGSVTSRAVATVQRTDSLPGAPEGEYEVVQFATVFANREQPAIETIIMMQGNEGWEVVGYFVR